MTGNGFLVGFLFVQFFVLGVIVAVVARHARAHFRPEKKQPEPLNPKPDFYLSPAVKEHLLHDSQAQFQSVVKHSAEKLQHDLATSGEQINSLIKKFATDIVESEMQRYREELEKLRKQADQEMGGLREEMAQHQSELKAKLAQEIEAEKQLLIKQIDTKLTDAMGSFLTEALQHNIDLGSQTEYLIAMLEEHKTDFVKEVSDENPAAK